MVQRNRGDISITDNTLEEKQDRKAIQTEMTPRKSFEAKVKQLHFR
jgi:hypothetical protein